MTKADIARQNSMMSSTFHVFHRRLSLTDGLTVNKNFKIPECGSKNQHGRCRIRTLRKNNNATDSYICCSPLFQFHEIHAHSAASAAICARRPKSCIVSRLHFKKK